MHSGGSVAQVPIFRGLGPETTTDLEAALTPLTVPRGTVVFDEDDPSDGIYFVVSGKIKLRRARTEGPSQRESLLQLLGPGTMFGELSALDDGHRSSTAVAVTHAELLHLGQGDLRTLMLQHPEIATAFVKQLAGRLRRADRVLSGLNLNDVTGRVAVTLLHLADTLGEQTPEGILVEHDLTQSELAAMVGATRETVNRTLTELAARGIIINGFRRVTIRQIDRLNQRFL